MDMESLSRENAGLIRLIARRYRRLCELDRAADLEDLIQAGHIGLWKAAETFDPNGGKTWTTWAGFYIRREMRALLGVASARRRADLGAVSTSTPFYSDEPDGETIGDMLADESLPDADEQLLRDEVRDTVRAAVERLPGRVRTSVRESKLHGVTYAALAAEEGVSLNAIRQDVVKGLRALRRDKTLIRLNMETRYYMHKGVNAYNRDWTSVTEGAALWRMEHERRV